MFDCRTFQWCGTGCRSGFWSSSTQPETSCLWRTRWGRPIHLRETAPADPGSSDHYPSTTSLPGNLDLDGSSSHAVFGTTSGFAVQGLNVSSMAGDVCSESCFDLEWKGEKSLCPGISCGGAWWSFASAVLACWNEPELGWAQTNWIQWSAAFLLFFQCHTCFVRENHRAWPSRSALFWNTELRILDLVTFSAWHGMTRTVSFI